MPTFSKNLIDAQLAPRVLPSHAAARVVTLRAKYDAAQTNDDNRRHWANADACSADAVANAGVRVTLRNRARYEVRNDCYAKGIISTVANDVVGPGGPRLQMIGLRKSIADKIEAAWVEYARAIRLAEKLRLMRESRAISGEVFAVQFDNPALLTTSILDLRILEPDHVTATLFDAAVENYYDGIHYDTFGNPLAYDVLQSHPGDNCVTSAMPYQADRIEARFVFHYYKLDRPGQRRAVPEITSALPLFAYRRRVALATIAATETAANHAGVVYSDAPPADPGVDGDIIGPFSFIELERNGAVALPQGWKISGFDAKQPQTTYKMFNDAIVAELGRCLNVPYTIAGLDSSESNMSAAYNDRSSYVKARVIEREELSAFLDWHFAAWFREMQLLGEFVSAKPKHQWFWPKIAEHADPSKVSNARDTDLGNGSTNLARINAAEGLDWETEIETAAKTLGITVPEYQALLRAKIFGNGNMQPGQEPGATPKAEPVVAEE